MKKLLILAALLAASSASAAGNFVFNAYVDAQYRCNWIEGDRFTLEAATLEEAQAEAARIASQSVTTTCTQVEYRCVHRQDVEPKPVYRNETRQTFTVIGGSIVDTVAKKEVAKLGTAYYHQNLRRQPRCESR